MKYMVRDDRLFVHQRKWVWVVSDVQHVIYINQLRNSTTKILLSSKEKVVFSKSQK